MLCLLGVPLTASITDFINDDSAVITSSLFSAFSPGRRGLSLCFARSAITRIVAKDVLFSDATKATAALSMSTAIGLNFWKSSFKKSRLEVSNIGSSPETMAP